MNRYLMICRLRWPALLLLTGVIALLVNFEKLTWGHAWPLYLILLGVLALAERAALASQPPENPYPGYQEAYQAGYPVGYQPGYPAGYPAGAYAAPAAGVPVEPPASSTSVAPAQERADVHISKPFTGSEEEGR